MRRWLPFPFLSLALAVMWLVLNASVEPAQVLLALLLGLAGGKVFARLRSPGGSVRLRARNLSALAWLAFSDIVRSNIAVGRIALNPALRGRTAGVGSSRVDLQACKLEYSIVSPK